MYIWLYIHIYILYRVVHAGWVCVLQIGGGLLMPCVNHLQRIAMEHPAVLGVREPMRQPLRLQQIEAVLVQVERLAASAIQTHFRQLRAHKTI